MAFNEFPEGHEAIAGGNETWAAQRWAHTCSSMYISSCVSCPYVHNTLQEQLVLLMLCVLTAWKIQHQHVPQTSHTNRRSNSN